MLVTIPSDVARGVVARSVAALSKGPNRVLGYVENMSGYYCRDCNAIKPLFDSSDRLRQGYGGPPKLQRRRNHRLGSPASGRSHSIQSFHGTAIEGSLSPNCPTHPLAAPWSMLRSNFWTVFDKEPR